jgi:hypothetical protein
MDKPDRLLSDYLLRGRQLQAPDMQTLERRWFAATERVNSTAGQRHVDAMREMDHIEAELWLRGLNPPQHRLL